MNRLFSCLGTSALACVLAIAALVPSSSRAQDPAAGAKPQQFVYVLKLTQPYQTETGWSQAANEAVSQHFKRLVEAAEAGKVILAGKTSEPLDQTFGLVVFEAANEVEARAFMNADPAVVAGVMTATLHPYSVALLRKP